MEDKWIQKMANLEKMRGRCGIFLPIERFSKKYKDNDFNCLIDAFFEKQKKLRPEQRQSSCMIACSCRKCSFNM